MDADRAEVIWMFDVASEPDGPVMCGVDELPAVVEQALAAAGCTEVGVAGIVSHVQSEGASVVGFDLVADVGDGSLASCCVLAGSAVDASVASVGARVRVWGRLGVDATGWLALEARDVQPTDGR